VGITTSSRKVPGRKACDKRHPYYIIIRGMTGIISKSLRQYLRNIPGKHEIKELQKSTILSTAHRLQKVLM